MMKHQETMTSILEQARMEGREEQKRKNAFNNSLKSEEEYDEAFQKGFKLGQHLASRSRLYYTAIFLASGGLVSSAIQYFF